MLALKIERLRDNRNGENFLFARDACDHRCGARTRTAAHTRGDKENVGIFDHFFKIGFAVLGGISADFRIGSRAQTFGALCAELNFHGRKVARQNLCIGIDRDVFRTRNPRLDHTVNGVVTRAAHTDHADFRFSVERRRIDGRLFVAPSSVVGINIVIHNQPPNPPKRRLKNLLLL